MVVVLGFADLTVWIMLLGISILAKRHGEKCEATGIKPNVCSYQQDFNPTLFYLKSMIAEIVVEMENPCIVGLIRIISIKKRSTFLVRVK